MLALMTDYRAHLEGRDCTKRTILNYVNRVRLYLLWCEDSKLDPLALDAVRGWRDQSIAAGLRPRTIRMRWVSLRSFFSWLEEKRGAEYPSVPDVSQVKIPSLDQPQRYIPTDEEVLALFNAAARMPRRTRYQRVAAARAQAVLALLAYTGIRRNELLCLDLEDLLCPSGKRRSWVVRVRFGKGREYREIPLSPACLEMVQGWVNARKEWLAGKASVAPAAAAALFPSDGSRRMCRNLLEQIYSSLRSLAGLDGSGITPHCLRAWFITRAAASTDIPTAARLAGHRSCDTTFKHYLKTDPTRERAAVNGVGETFRRPVAPAAIEAVIGSAKNRRAVVAEFFQQRRRSAPSTHRKAA